MLNEKQIVSFYYPTAKIGGAQLLFSRIAEHLQKRGFSIRIYEHTESFISNFLKRKNICFEIVNAENNGKFSAGDSEIFLLSLSFIKLIFRDFRFDNDTRFVFWDLHTNCLIDQTAFSGLYKKISNNKIRSRLIKLLDFKTREKLNSLVEIGTQKYGILFMCNYNHQFNRDSFEFKNEVHLLPIAVEIDTFQNTLTEPDTSYVRIGWISRLERDKNKILTLLIDDIAKSKVNIELTIIGNGSDEKYIKDYVLNSGLSRVTFAGKIETQNLSHFLSKNIDIGFSMGTSALEFALMKIPTVLVPATTEFKYFLSQDKRYEWLPTIGGYDVCTYKVADNSYKTFNSILNYYVINRQSLKEESYSYVVKNHSIETVINDLTRILSDCSLTFAGLREVGIDTTDTFAGIPFMLKRFYKKLKKVSK